MKNLTFAPKDTTPIDFTPKDNYHGIDYSGLNPKAALQSGHLNLFETEAKLSRSGKRGIRGQVLMLIMKFIGLEAASFLLWRA